MWRPCGAGAAHLIGKHDFTTFRASMCQAKSPMKTLDAVEIEEVVTPNGRELRFHLRARSFLHNQVAVHRRHVGACGCRVLGTPTMWVMRCARLTVRPAARWRRPKVCI